MASQMTLGLSTTSRVSLARKFSGRQLDEEEQDEQRAKFERIQKGDLFSDENDVYAGIQLKTKRSELDEIPENGPVRLPAREESLTKDNIDDSDEIPVLPALVAEDLQHNKNTWRDLYVNHELKQLAEVAMEEEIRARLKDKKALYVADTEWSAFVMQQILLSTDRILLESLLFGNLAKDRRANPKLETILAGLGRQCEYQPGIYYQSLVDKHGESPSAEELSIICDFMIGYVMGTRQPQAQHLIGTVNDAFANKVDNFRQSLFKQIPLPRSAEGYRKYLSTKPQVKVDLTRNPITRYRWRTQGQSIPKPTEKYSKSHVKEVLHFVEMLRKRLATIASSDQKKPLQFPLVEVGYSKRCIDQLKGHAQHRNSNNIMNLTESICGALQSKLGKLYKIEQAVIYLIWAPEQAEISEIGFTKLTEGYTHNAGGFSHFPAGLSNHSANQIVAREWNAAKKYMIEHSMYFENLRLRNEEKEKEVLALEQQVDKMWEQRSQKHKANHEVINQRMADQSGDTEQVKDLKIRIAGQLEDLQKTTDANAKYLLDLVTRLEEIQLALPSMRKQAYAMDNLNRYLRLLSTEDTDGESGNDSDAPSSIIQSSPPRPRGRHIMIMTSKGRKIVTLHNAGE